MPRSKKSKEWTVTLHDTQNAFGVTKLLRSEDEFGIPCVPYFKQLEEVVIFLPDNLKFMVAQLEKTTTGLVHLQGYIELLMDYSLDKLKIHLKTIFGDSVGRCHFEVAAGSRKTNVAYCQKEDTRLTDSDRPKFIYERAGTCDETSYKDKKRANVADYLVTEKVYELLETKSVDDVLRTAVLNMKSADTNEAKEFWNKVIMRIERSHSSLDMYVTCDRVAQKRSRNFIEKRQVQVKVLYGPPGTGKTRRAFVEYGNSLYKKAGYSKWWCGYTDQICLLLDDFKGETGPNAYLTPDMLQQICEGWELAVEGKHKRSNSSMAAWKVVVITTNLTFDEWYKNWDGICPAVRQSILSRIPLTCWETINGHDHRLQQHIQHPVSNLSIIEI